MLISLICLEFRIFQLNFMYMYFCDTEKAYFRSQYHEEKHRFQILMPKFVSMKLLHLVELLDLEIKDLFCIVYQKTYNNIFYTLSYLFELSYAVNIYQCLNINERIENSMFKQTSFSKKLYLMYPWNCMTVKCVVFLVIKSLEMVNEVNLEIFMVNNTAWLNRFVLFLAIDLKIKPLCL